MLVPEEAARLRGVDVRTVYRWLEAGTAHFLEVPGGVVVCLNSITSNGGNE
jgi:predicted site-specific integrase-resolvase